MPPPNMAPLTEEDIGNTPPDDMGADITPMDSEPMDDADKPMEICVPASVVSTQDGSDNLVAPEIGDEVPMDVVAKVTRVEGDNVYLIPVTVNGEDVTPDEPKAPEDERGKVLAAAQEADGLGGGGTEPEY